MSEVVGTVVELWRYPVKSLLGERVPSLAFDARGAVGDRVWAVRAPDGRLGSGKTGRRFLRMDGLLRMRASISAGEPSVTLATGETFGADDPRLVEAIGAVVGMPVTLVTEDGVAHVDAAPVHLVTTSSLADWAGAAGADRVASRRARPNLVVAVEERGRAEDGWQGRTLAVGDARLRVTERTERCVMVTAEQDGLDRDARLLRALAPNDRCVGVYAEVLGGGRVTEGDDVRLVP